MNGGKSMERQINSYRVHMRARDRRDDARTSVIVHAPDPDDAAAGAQKFVKGMRVVRIEPAEPEEALS